MSREKRQWVRRRHGDYFTPEATRPLSIVNSDNRILASAARLAWEPLITPLIGSHRQGFLQGRSLTRNLIDFDYFSMLASLTEQHSAAILFDFRSALPSISQTVLNSCPEVLRLTEVYDKFCHGIVRPEPLRNRDGQWYVPGVYDEVRGETRVPTIAATICFCAPNCCYGTCVLRFQT